MASFTRLTRVNVILYCIEYNRCYLHDRGKFLLKICCSPIKGIRQKYLYFYPALLLFAVPQKPKILWEMHLQNSRAGLCNSVVHRRLSSAVIFGLMLQRGVCWERRKNVNKNVNKLFDTLVRSERFGSLDQKLNLLRTVWKWLLIMLISGFYNFSKIKTPTLKTVTV